MSDSGSYTPATPNSPSGSFWKAAMNTPTGKTPDPDSGSQPIVMTQAQLQQLLAAAAGKSSTQKKSLPAPRVGGSTEIYAWTGAGAQGKGKISASRYCAREFSGDPHKAFQTLATIETMCRSAPPWSQV